MESSVHRKRPIDDFTVIHSLPWLSQAASEIDRRPVPTGEIDFLILHPTFGILAVEVKGGKLRYEQQEFVYPNGTRIDPVRQVRRGVHGLAQWLFGVSKQGYHIGYALAFPESLMQGRALPPALIDGTKNPPQPICIDRTDLPYIRSRIEEIMKYWQQALGSQSLTNHQIQKIITFLCPIADYSPTWMERITENTERWLLLTSEQTKRISQLSICHRSVSTGRSGTGKTLLAMIQARQFSQEGKKVLFLVYNVQLASAVRDDLADLPTLHVIHFHDLCRTAARNLGQPADTQEREWYKETAPRLLKQAIDQNKLPLFDALIEAAGATLTWSKQWKGWLLQEGTDGVADDYGYQVCVQSKHHSSLAHTTRARG